MAFPVHGVVGHVHVSLADSLAFDTTEMDGLLLGVILDDLDDRKAVDGGQMGARKLLKNVDELPESNRCFMNVIPNATHGSPTKLSPRRG